MDSSLERRNFGFCQVRRRRRFGNAVGLGIRSGSLSFSHEGGTESNVVCLHFLFTASVSASSHEFLQLGISTIRSLFCKT